MASPEAALQRTATAGDRVFAWLMSRLGPHASWRLKDRKLALFQRLGRERGVSTVVEVGMGTAPNLELYGPRVDKIIGVDINPAMHQYARKAAEAAGVADKLQLILGRAEALPLEDGSADAVIMTHVLCSVSDQAAALREAKRVLRPGGCLLFLEHVAAPPGEALRTWQRMFNPVVSFVGHGCSATRDTLDAIRAAGFAAVDADSFRLKLWSPAVLVAPHVAGAAVK